MSKRPNVCLIYTANGSGLGHLHRAVLIANALANLGWSTIIASGNPCPTFFPVVPGVDIVSLPCLKKTPGGLRSSRTGYADVDSIMRLRKSILMTLVNDLKPILFVVDHKPAGILGEIHIPLQMLKSNGARTVLLLRDFGGQYESVRDSWYHDPVPATLPMFDSIMALGVPSAYDWSPLLRDFANGRSLSYTGFLASKHYRICPIGSRVGTLLIAGGGAHGFDFLQQALIVSHKLPSPITMCLGPMMAPSDRSLLYDRGSARGIRVVHSIPGGLNLDTYQLVISQAGSIVTDLAYFGILSILCPRTNQENEEQNLRARYWAKVAPYMKCAMPRMLEITIEGLNALSPRTYSLISETQPGIFISPAEIASSLSADINGTSD